MSLPYLQLRNGWYQYRRYIPPELRASLGKREFVKSLKTRDKNIASRLYSEVNEKFDAILEAANHGGGFSINALHLATRVGLKVIPEDSPNGEQIEQLIKNVEAVRSLPNDPVVRGSALSATLDPRISISDIYEKYLETIQGKRLKRSKRENDKALNPILRAIKEWTEFIGDEDVRKLKKEDGIKFKNKLLQDVELGKITSSTANKKLIHLRKIFNEAIDVYYPNLKNPLNIRGIEFEDKSKQNPFTEEEIKSISAAIPSSKMNEQLKAIIFVAMSLGTGCKELALLTSKDIVLDAPIPFIRIGPNEFRSRVKHGGERHRDVPLFGEALKWIKKFPDGFDRYRRDGGGEAISAAAKKFLSKHSDKKQFYSFRHRVADLLRNSGCEDRLADAIMGHRQSQIGLHYGEGYSLETKLQALKKAFKYSSKRLENNRNINAQRKANNNTR